MRDRDAAPMQRWADLLRVVSGDSGGSWRLLQPERLRRALRGDGRILFGLVQLGGYVPGVLLGVLREPGAVRVRGERVGVGRADRR